jgi:mannose-1-phosphate guanylyltransferase
MILAAGLGTRLRPLTLRRPKTLVPVGNIAVIDRIISYLKVHGVTDLVINAHHYPEQLLRHVRDNRAFGVRIETRVEPEILGTGGGIRNTMDFWDRDPFIVINGDILTDIDLHLACEAHRRNQALATLVLHERAPFNQVEIDRRMNILEIGEENAPGRLAFTGIHIIEPELLNFIPAGIYSNIIDCYRRLIRSGRSIKAYISENHYWRDIGTIDSYVQANRESLGKGAFLAGSGSRIDPSAHLFDWAVIGDGTVIQKGAEIRRSILWENVKVGPGLKVSRSIVTAGREVTEDVVDRVI